LVDKSLVQVGSGDGDGPRYSMLETVRQYARARLEASGLGHRALARHVGYFLEFAKSAQARLSSDAMRLWLKRLDLELPNLLAAQARCSQLPDGAEIGLELAANLRGYWLARGLFALGQGMYEDALARTSEQPRSALRGKTLYALGQHHYVSGQMDKAIPPLEEAYSIAREQGDDETVVYCLDKLGQAYVWQGDMARAEQASDEQLLLAERTGDPRLVGFALTARGHACRARDDFAQAAEAFEKALTLFESGHDVNNIHNALIHVARASISWGKLDRARVALAATIRLVGEMGISYRGHFALDASARLAAAEQDFPRAARFQGASDAAMEKVGAKLSWFDDSVLTSLRAGPRLALGEEAYRAAHAGGRELPIENALAEASACLGPGAHTFV
jgi:non-specific serine/threonine protein kinase